MVSSTAAHDTAPARWSTRDWALLFVLSGNMFLDAIEVSVVLVALPVVAGRFGLSPFGVQWLMSGFALGFAAVLPFGPRLCARIGSRRAYLVATLVFALASAAAGAIGNLAPLILIRVVKGGCAAMTAPTGLAIINDTFAEGPARRRAVSVYSFFGASGFTIGLLLAGLLAEHGWRWVFVFPAPIAAVLLLTGRAVLPRHAGGGPVRSPRWGLMRNPGLRRGALGGASLNGTYHGLLVLLVFRMHEVCGWGPWRTALALLPACVPLMVTAPFSGRLVARYGTGRLVAVGALLALLGCGFYLFRAGTGGYALGVLPAIVLVEAAFCVAFAALNMTVAGSVDPADRAGAVAGYQMCVQLGASVVVPSVGLLLGDVHALRVHTLSPALWLVTAVAAAGFAVAVTGWPRRTDS